MDDGYETCAWMDVAQSKQYDLNRILNDKELSE